MISSHRPTGSMIVSKMAIGSSNSEDRRAFGASYGYGVTLLKAGS